MSFFDDPIVLDVTLIRHGQLRRWTITRGASGWTFRVVESSTVTVSGCATNELAWARQKEWEAEIAAAEADGWTRLVNPASL